MQRNTNTSHQACAACKHQRKKCTDKCILAPFFPAEKAREFQAVHKVFGVSNVQKIVKGLAGDDDRKRAADSLIWEAFCRQRDPVLGPYGEYRRVYDELRLYKTASHRANHQVPAAHQGGVLYKAAAGGGGGGVVGWKIGNHGAGGGQGSILNSSSYFGSSGFHESLKGQEKELEIGGCVVSTNHLHHNHNHNHNHPHQQQLIGGFNQQFYQISGQLSPLDVKSIESSIWEDAGS
ncbi:hypothetical protein V2J09_019210 [Rumex salicifolius]